uniref:Splicing factor 3B subunit 6 n=1 Tax=Electrophorus electricus TaxID=8005 RepID=A0A4W4EMG3_ELEEL
MAMQAAKRANIRLPPEVNRILYIRNLPYKITAEEMYDIFGKYGPIRQIRVGNTPETRGTAYVVYEDIFDAKNACDHLSGFNVCNRYLVVLYYNANRVRLRLPTKYCAGLMLGVLGCVCAGSIDSIDRVKEKSLIFFPLLFRHSRKWTQRKRKSS